MNIFSGKIEEDEAGVYLPHIKEATQPEMVESRRERGPPDGKMSREYWKPNLSQSEWSLLNRTLDREISSENNYLDDSTKWTYAKQKGIEVFAVYGIGDGTEPTVLFAEGGKNAYMDSVAVEEVLWEVRNGTVRTAAAYHRWFKNMQRAARRNNAGGSNAQNRGAAVGAGGVSGNRGGQSAGQQGSNAKSAGNRGGVTGKASRELDSEGRQLTEGQADYFAESKSVDAQGRLKVMYRGDNGNFTVFDRRKSSYSNLYGRGFYFTDSKTHAEQYGNARAFYLNITNPVPTERRTITKDQMLAFLEAVAENEDDYSFENYGYGATPQNVLQAVFSGKSDFAMLYDVSQTAIGDMVEAVELFNAINGTDFDGLILDTETVIFRSEQAKSVTNENPTTDPDTRFSMEPTSEFKPKRKVNAAEFSDATKQAIKDAQLAGMMNQGRKDADC